MDDVRMIQGDCFDILPTLDAGSVDAVIMDMPYGTTNLPWDHKIDLARLWELIKYVLKPGGVTAAFSQQPFSTDLINSNRAWFRYELIWRKTAPVGFLDANRRPMRVHENILVFCENYRRSNDGKRAAMTYNPQMTVGSPYKRRGGTNRAAHYSYSGATKDRENTGTRFPVDVLDFANRGGPAYHPTQKPVDLMEWLVRTYTREGELVVDPFAGAGSTLVACKKVNRYAIGIELKEEYIKKYKIRTEF